SLSARCLNKHLNQSCRSVVCCRSPSYQVSGKKGQEGGGKSKKQQQQAQTQQQHGNHSTSPPQQPHSGVILEASTVAATVQQQLRSNNGGSGIQVESVATPSAVTIERKPTKDGLTKVLKNVATSSISADSMSLSSPPGTSVQSPRDFDKCDTPMPQEVQQLTENLQNLLLGRIAATKTTTKTRKIVIYVCAADSQDCCVEKGTLHNTVYPELRNHCLSRGYELHIVDLHWKTGLEKQQDHEFPELCLGELSRQMEVAYVIPVLFLSNSLGTPLLPKTIENQDFEMALSNADNKELLQKWYQLDSHAQPPCYRLQPIASHIPGFKNLLAEKHILRMPVRWVEGGLDPELPDHAQYVSEVTTQLAKHIRALVDNIIEEDQTKSMKSYSELLPRLLAASCLHRPQVIMIDGIDQVNTDYGTQNLDWLPVKLPENVKLILSVADDSAVFAEIKKKLSDSAALIPMPALGKAEAQSILMASVMQYNHSVSSRVQDCVRSSVQDCTLPLYVKVLAWQTSWWTDKDHDIVPKGNLTDQLHLMLQELEVILGKERVEHALALVTAAKTGLSDSEMLDLLAHDAAFHSKATYVLWAPSCLFWARLNKYLAPFLQWSSVDGPSTLHWKDQMLYSAVKQKYLGDQNRQQWAHQTLIQFYQGKWADEPPPGMTGRHLSQPDKTNNCYNRRKLDELPYQVFQLKGSIKEEFLYNHSWLYVKLCGSDVYQKAIEAAGKEKEKDLLFLKKCLEDSSCALAYDGRQFYSQMYGHLSLIFNSTDGKTSDLKKKSSSTEPHFESPDGYKFMKELYNACCNPPVLSLLPLQPLVGGNSEAEGGKNTMDKLSVSAATAGGAAEVDDLDHLCRFDMVTRLVENPDYVITVSTEREEISVWDVHDAIPIRTLIGVTHPINLKAIDDTRCVVLCRRELRIYDLDSGEFVTRLKGVMNQKMPYYGLHDKEHLVALSRNRMYVNLMNLESGDCVTTFKAGEDRFLNSLLVSGDGRVLVCGDETQKPFPLLVWNLASRKLLYDLRIPHHDFVTSLAAITHEGHYVCCVAKEVDEPCPNFIVVYDLQSGTLFKKWKPGVNTVSLDISSQDSCVISGLEDARILVWDLTTGNCRWYLCGHTAPVNFLRLDSLGGSFLSADSNCRDRSLRLWDLNKGELQAVYTPERPVTSCEVTSGGRAVVLALRGRSNITTLQLRGPIEGDSTVNDTRSYGKEENKGKTFDLRDEAR
ncbi:hypothetical protein C0J52_09490, partial [Blattella germanica]